MAMATQIQIGDKVYDLSRKVEVIMANGHIIGATYDEDVKSKIIQFNEDTTSRIREYLKKTNNDISITEFVTQLVNDKINPDIILE